MSFNSLTFWLVLLIFSDVVSAVDTPPAGFTALFDGVSLEGWHGRPHVEPEKLAAMTADERAKQLQQWTDESKLHWRVENGELVNDGEGPYLTTNREFGDIEFRIEYRTVAQADSGIYLRGTPQVQIWDFTKAGANGIVVPIRGPEDFSITHREPSARNLLSLRTARLANGISFESCRSELARQSG